MPMPENAPTTSWALLALPLLLALPTLCTLPDRTDIAECAEPWLGEGEGEVPRAKDDAARLWGRPRARGLLTMPSPSPSSSLPPTLLPE